MWNLFQRKDVRLAQKCAKMYYELKKAERRFRKAKELFEAVAVNELYTTSVGTISVKETTRQTVDMSKVKKFLSIDELIKLSNIKVLQLAKFLGPVKFQQVVDKEVKSKQIIIKLED